MANSPEKRCDFCGNLIDREIERGRPSRFCSDVCHDAYHNNHKRLKRLERTMKADFEWLVLQLTARGQLSSDSLNLIRRIESFGANFTHIVTCENCGQTRFEAPEKDELCYYCKKSAWRISAKAKPL